MDSTAAKAACMILAHASSLALMSKQSIASVRYRHTIIQNADKSLAALQLQFIAFLVKENCTLIHTGAHPKTRYISSAHKDIGVS